MKFLLFVLIVLKCVSAQICNDTISVTREVPETYQYTYYEAYEDNDCVLCPCIKSRMAVNIGTRLVEKQFAETVSVCCEGYVEDQTYNGDGLKCIPVCNPTCDNGYCRNPNECACEAGYANDPNDPLKRCVPLCLEGCSTPNCLQTCQLEDYDTPETDMCDGTCSNGTCVAPSICHCDPGYSRNSQACEPICSSCEHGTCLGPELCKCNFGWREECGYCQPVCSGCEHGLCKAPGQCECDPGYKAENARCEPHCPSCDNGICIAPDTCACDPGWYLNEAGTECLAHCDVACGNGTCVAPNVCECYAGYKVLAPQEVADKAPLCKPVCNNCDWLCIAPDVCKCEEHLETVYTTLDGAECDCFNCTDESRKCNKITCRAKVTNVEDSIERLNESEVFMSHTNSEVGTIANKTVIDMHESMNGTESYANRTAAEFRFQWLYVAIIIVEMMVILLLLAIMVRQDVIKRLKRRKFVPQDKGKPNTEVAVQYNSSVAES